MTKHFKIIARHKWVAHATITESYCIEDDSIRRFTATILGWRNWKIYEGGLGKSGDIVLSAIINRVKEIRSRIEKGDNLVFKEDVSIQEMSV